MDQLTVKHFLARMWKQRDDESPPVNSKDATVLVVDDSRTVVHTLQKILEQAGYLTLPAFDGLQAVEVARRRLPDLILMDIVMPRMNGFEATRALSREQSTQYIPVVIVSGVDQPSDRVWAMRLGAKAFLAKPIRKDELLVKIAAVLNVTRQRLKREISLTAEITPPGTPGK